MRVWGLGFVIGLVAQGGLAVTLEHLEALIFFNHPPPFLQSPFEEGLSVEIGAKHFRTRNGSNACVVDFFEETRELYQLKTVPWDLAAKKKFYGRVNHYGTCGLCSSMKDLATFAQIERDQERFEEANQICIGLSAFTRDWAVECYRDVGFTAPCAELLYMRASKGVKTCGFRCALDLDFSKDCYKTCESEMLDEIFQNYAGRHFLTPINLEELELPQIRKPLVAEEDKWQHPEYGDHFLDLLKSKVAVNMPARPEIDPYLDPNFDTFIDPDEVCAVKFLPPENIKYELHTYANEEAARNDSAIVTHKGACGLCSSLHDLVVYVGTPDLTTPVQRCALKSLISEAWSLKCLHDIGFSQPCADIWFFNARHTRTRCLSICMRLISAPNNLPDGSLNRCILCDEEMSGPHFKKGSARTRRNSGIFSAITRPGPAIYELVHTYPNSAQPNTSSTKGLQEKDEL